MNSRRSSHRSRLWLPALCLLASTALLACSGAGGGGTGQLGSDGASGAGTQACSNCGTAVVSMTDAPGDFVSYIVDIDSLSLTRSDGTVVQTIPNTTQVDLTQLVNLSEIISADQIPAGRYVSASITIDYNGATLVLDNGSGVGVTIAQSNIINGVTSLPLAPPNPTQMTLTLSLDPNSQLTVSPNVIANLALDFNLAASNTIAPSDTAPSTVTVNPVLTASLAPDTTKQLRVRGPLLSTNTASGSYLIEVRPFNNFSGSSGEFALDTTSATTYSINGTSYTGSAGLTALATLTAGTLTVAYGSWSQSTGTFTASSVVAGTSVAGSAQSSVQGTVLSRSGDTLTLANGLVFQPNQGGMGFMPELSVTVGANTVVTEQGQTGTFSIADISVGQQLQLSGSAGPVSAGAMTFDATSGSAMLLPTALVGTVTASTATSVTLDLQTLDGRSASSFNFAGTGSSGAEDATAAAYVLAVPSSLSTASLGVGLPAMFSGFAGPFGQAPPDFTASTLTSYAQARARLEVRWTSPGVAAPFATLSSSELLISQTTLQASSLGVIQIASVQLNPSTLSSGLQLVPDTSASVLAFAIVHWKSWSVDSFSTFNDFATALSTDLNGTTTALQVAARGPYDATTGVLSAEQLIVVLDD